MHRRGGADTKPAHDDTPTRPGWATWITCISIALALVALGWTIYSVGLHVLLHRLAMLGPWLFAIVGIEILITGCDAAAIHAFIGKDGKHSYLHVIVAQVAGRAINVITPFGSLGEVVKIAMLVERVQQARAVAAVLLYNLFGLEMSLVLIAVGAPLTTLMHLPHGLRPVLFVAGAAAAGLAVALPLLVHHGMLSSIVGFARKLHILSERRVSRWRKKLESVDDRLRDGSEARQRERLTGFGFMLLSRLLTWATTALLVYAARGPTSLGFLAAIVTAGQLLTWLSATVPLGLGVSEGGNYALFRLLGADPAAGVTMALGRRVTHIVYAAIGIVLVSVSQTVRRVRRSGQGRQ